MPSTRSKSAADIGPLHVVKSGQDTTISFTAEPSNDWMMAAECRDRLLQLLDECVCERLLIDAEGINFLSSSWLELLVSPIREGVDVSLCNVSSHLRTILERTRLERLVSIQDAKS